MSVLDAFDPREDPGAALVLADRALEDGDDRLAAAALDRAYGLDPRNERTERLRAEVLSRLEVREHGLVWRYVPAGTFLMGSRDGDPDERPVHPVRVDGFWLMDTPMTWADENRLRGFEPPPNGGPSPEPEGWSQFQEGNHYKIRGYYCADGEDRRWEPGAYGRKPLVTAGWQDAEATARAISGNGVWYGLPTEAEWERAARGGRIGCRFPWGDEEPAPGEMDFGRFGDFALADPRTTRPNGYGLYAMCGSVWEWTADLYDALAYTGAPPGTEAYERVIRGGSWADSAAACTVSFRSSLGSVPLGDDEWGDNMTPCVGYRLARYEGLPAHIEPTLVPPERR
ncbi:MAG: formylglycine-generating enzyme family protein [Alphaproteobacteria bacterium]|nr:formylglycine-generating enzyme family protein [Alphaproteobacteria bacterium]